MISTSDDETEFVFGNRSMILNLMATEIEELRADTPSFLKSISHFSEFLPSKEDYNQFRTKDSASLDDVIHLMSRALKLRQDDFVQAKAAHKIVMETYMVHPHILTGITIIF